LRKPWVVCDSWGFLYEQYVLDLEEMNINYAANGFSENALHSPVKHLRLTCTCTSNELGPTTSGAAAAISVCIAEAQLLYSRNLVTLHRIYKVNYIFI